MFNFVCLMFLCRIGRINVAECIAYFKCYNEVYYIHVTYRVSDGDGHPMKQCQRRVVQLSQH